MRNTGPIRPEAIRAAIAEKSQRDTEAAERRATRRAQKIAQHALRQASKGHTEIHARPGRFGAAFSNEVVHGKVVELLGDSGLQVAIEQAVISPSFDRLSDDIIHVLAVAEPAASE